MGLAMGRLEKLEALVSESVGGVLGRYPLAASYVKPVNLIDLRQQRRKKG